jgi:hypothetical protein
MASIHVILDTNEKSTTVFPQVALPGVFHATLDLTGLAFIPDQIEKVAHELATLLLNTIPKKDEASAAAQTPAA